MFLPFISKGSLRHIVATNTASQLLGRVISVVTMAIVSFLIAQRFGAVGYGDFVKVTTYTTFFYTLADFGLNAAYLQHITNGQSTKAAVAWQRLFGLRLFVSCILLGLAICTLFLLPLGNEQGYTASVKLGILLFAPVIVVQGVITTTNAWFQRILRYDLATVAQNAGSILMMVAAIILFVTSSYGGTIIGVTALFLGSAVTMCVALYYVRRTGSSILPTFVPSFMKRELWYAFPLGLTLIFNLIYFHSDSIVLTLTRSTHEVGIYGLAYKVFELPLVLPVFFINAVFPLLLSTGVKDVRASQKIFWLSLKFLVISSVVITILLWMMSPFVTIVRPEFSESIMPLRILLLGLPIFFVTALFMWVLIAERRQWLLLGIHTLAMMLNIGLNILLIPRHGYVAAAWTTGGSELFILVLSAVALYPILQKYKRQS